MFVGSPIPPQKPPLRITLVSTFGISPMRIELRWTTQRSTLACTAAFGTKRQRVTRLCFQHVRRIALQASAILPTDAADYGLRVIRVAGSVVCASVSITAEREGGTDLPGGLAA